MALISFFNLLLASERKFSGKVDKRTNIRTKLSSYSIRKGKVLFIYIVFLTNIKLILFIMEVLVSQ